jgi:geranylgeranyl diphosphate synthase type II
MKNSLNEKISAYGAIIDENLKKYLSNEQIPEKMRDAMSYSVLAGGKRLRPALTLAACELFQGKSEKAIPFACGIEMIHTYSLIHDDLPAMDNDDYRRGRLTSHKVFGEDKAILAGDALLSYAFEIMIDACKDSDDLKALKYVANAAGACGMVAGQWVDVSSNGIIIDKEKMEYIHMNKTAAMIIGSILAGASCAGASFNDLMVMEAYGKEIGYTFQIVDDILDVTGDSQQLGKATGSDVANQKTTYVTLYGIEGAKDEAEKHTEAAKTMMALYGDKGMFFVELADYLLSRKN